MSRENQRQALICPDNLPESALENADNGPADLDIIRQNRLAQIPPRQRPIFLRTWTGNSREAAFRAFCLECVGYESAEVNRCTVPACPLYTFRGRRL